VKSRGSQNSDLRAVKARRRVHCAGASPGPAADRNNMFAFPRTAPSRCWEICETSFRLILVRRRLTTPLARRNG
jgi:hypothetical protein